MTYRSVGDEEGVKSHRPKCPTENHGNRCSSFSSSQSIGISVFKGMKSPPPEDDLVGCGVGGRAGGEKEVGPALIRIDILDLGRLSATRTAQGNKYCTGPILP